MPVAAAGRRLVTLLALASVGCATFSLRSDRCPVFLPASAAAVTTPDSEVKVQYLGSGGYLIRRGPDVVLFGPVYSNPSLVEVGFDHQIRTDRATVDRYLPADADQASAIIIGHSHYDHALDTPYIANEHATGATVYGSRTMVNLISSAVDSSRLADVGPAAAAHTFIQINPRLRVWPIRSEHSDQTRLELPFGLLNTALFLWRGEVTEPQDKLPDTASQWAQGEVYAYVLDFMDAPGTADEKVAFRVYYQDSGTNDPVGFPPESLLSEHPVDVSLICVGGDFERLANHPGGIIAATAPRFLVLGHWENFFEPQADICATRRVDAIPRSDTREFVGEAEEAMSKAGLMGKPILPCPTASVFHFPVDKANDAAVHRVLRSARASFDCGTNCVP